MVSAERITIAKSCPGCFGDVVESIVSRFDYVYTCVVHNESANDIVINRLCLQHYSYF